jgi:murein DD-endopeptidase MepM/ murein hydrolase activator NlpD
MTALSSRDTSHHDWLLLLVRAGGQPKLFRLSNLRLALGGVLSVGVIGLGSLAIAMYSNLARDRAALQEQTNLLEREKTQLTRQNQALEVQLNASMNRIAALEQDRSRVATGLEREKTKFKRFTAKTREIQGKVARLQSRIEQVGAASSDAQRTSSTGQAANVTGGPDKLLASLFDQLSNTDRRAKVAVAALEAQADQEARIPSGWPVQGSITSTFGFRIGPRTGKLERHTGWDIAIDAGTPADATGAGKVLTAGWSSVGYGLHVVIDHGNGLKTLYGHLSKLEVAEGDEIALGQTVGLVGSTGNSTGPHLHYEVRLDDVAVDPGPFLDRERPVMPTVNSNEPSATTNADGSASSPFSGTVPTTSTPKKP